MPRAPWTATVVLLVLFSTGGVAFAVPTDGATLELSTRVNDAPYDPTRTIGLTPGETIHIEFIVTNTGSTTSRGYNVWVEGKKDVEWPILSRDDASLEVKSTLTNNGWVCNDPDCYLAPGGSVTVSLTMRVPDDANGEYGTAGILDSDAGGGRIMVSMFVNGTDDTNFVPEGPPTLQWSVPSIPHVTGTTQTVVQIVGIFVTVISIFVGVAQLLSD